MKEETIEEQLRYRYPMKVTEILYCSQEMVFPICPRCNKTLERDYQCYCDRCGQCLNWKSYNKATIKYGGKYR